MQLKSALQDSLEEGTLRRNLLSYESSLPPLPGNLRLRAWMRRRFLESESSSLSFLDAGCGQGFAVNHFAWHMPFFLSTETALRGAYKSPETIARALLGIGIDTNPLAVPGDESDKARARTIYKTSNVETMEGIEDGSVDLGIGFAVLRYVDDKLAAVKSGWRVLKPRGVFAWLIHKSAFTEPSWNSLGCDPEQHTWQDSQLNGEEVSWIITEKKDSSDGLPDWRFLYSKNPYEDREKMPHEHFDKVSVYEKR